MRRIGATVAVALLLTACVGPVRSFSTYEGKAADTADSVGSAVQTARLAVTEAAQGRALATYLSVVFAEAESDAGGSGAIFSAIQPPDERSARLRTQLLDLIGRAESTLADLRIAVRWGDLDRLAGIAAPLSSLERELSDFAEAHS